MMPRQLALPFPHGAEYRGGGLLPAPSNAEAQAWLRRTAAWPGLRLVLWGPAGVGKTHALHAWAAGLDAAVLSGPSLRAAPVPSGPVAVDDAELAGSEHALFHLLNAAADAGHPVLLAARTPPARWPVRLPDLASRLRAAPAVQLLAPEDALLRALLGRLLAERQLVVADAVQDWLLARLPRTAAAVREAACRLDRLALAGGGRVTRAVAATVADALAQDDAEDPHDDGEESETYAPSRLPATARLF